MAGGGIPEAPESRENRGGGDSLGRRDGPAFGPSDGHQLRAQGANAGDPGDGPAVRLLDDFDDHQPGDVAVHGFQRGLQSAGDDPVCEAAFEELPPENVLDY